jgi:serine/threonine protein kinase
MLSADSRLFALRDWLPGQVLRGTQGARYHLRERIGEGGQGWVFRANWDEPGGYAVVVKVLRPDAVTPESLSRFEREAHVLRMLGQAARPNPHVVRFFDHATAHLSVPGGGEPIALPFTVLEYVHGTTLQDVLAKGAGVGMALDRARRIARQIVLALEDVHAHKVVHRDLKPSNVLLANQGGVEVAKVTDFGLVKLVDIGLGRTAALAGATLGYAPPEQFEQGNRRVSRRTDVFSFAAVFYEMLTGVRAFPHGDAENPLVVVTRLLNGPRPTLGSTRGVLPRELAMRPEAISGLDALLVRATASEPTERHASIGELWRAVEQVLGAASERPSPPLPPTGLAVAIETATAIDLPAPLAAASHPAWEGSPEERAGGWRRSSEPPELNAKLPPPAFWRWRVRVPPLRTAAVRAALFDPGGESAIAVGASGFLRWESSEWIYGSGTPEVDPRAVRGLARLGHGELVVYGAGGLAARLVPGQRLEAWVVSDRELTFLGAYVDARESTVTLVGERPGRRSMPRATDTMAIVAQFSRGKLALLSDVPPCARLRGATRVQAGEIVCCGDGGSIVRLEKGTAHHVGSICGGNLHAIASLTDGSAVTVGAGGHALLLSPRLQGQLEAVQTTRDLLSLAVDSSGVAWAGSAQARLLRRTAGSWVRMSAELRLSSSVVALWAAPHAVRAICDDGAFIEGTLSDDHVDG